ncbi:MAG TPA: TrbC/VirB2 family protein [Oligoflexia bacterium]|nr:TrbC/VirB2 family protein [Oligoflexia bacterium]HMP49134.1 TrbC/VirB2 family protein [Oligoflexia bacterium]
MNEKTAALKYIKSAFLGILTAVVIVPTSAYAQIMPWENPLRQLLNSLQGPTAQIIIIMAIVIAGLAFCVGEAGSFFRRCSAAVFGGAIAIGASSWAPTLFGW